MILSKLSKSPLNQVQSLLINRSKALEFGGWGAAGGAVGSILGELFQLNNHHRGFFLFSLLEVGCWFALIGVCISVALLIGDSRHVKQGFQVQQAIQRIGLFSVAAGFGAGAIAQGIYLLLGPTEVLRVICWGLAAGLLGFGLGQRIPNLGMIRGSIGGGLGGLVGGCLFLLFTWMLDDSAGRLLGVSAIGFWIGIMMVVLDSLLREAWIVVRWGDREAITLPLGSTPLLLGSSSDCRIRLSKQDFPPLTAKIYLENSQVVMEFDPVMHQQKSMKILRHVLGHGDRRKFGDISLEVQTSTE